ncbi:MAG: homocysteine S-methyltransferase [Candidatus Roseilinea sp.]|nr:MAG: homocysteine S-methyltransferase [Candidatus Roseilinea sp.]
MGTELTRRGVDTTLPLWSAIALDAAPEVVAQIHRDYLDAGAHVITTNTFRTNVRALAKAGIAHRARELTFRAVELARQAVAQWRQGDKGTGGQGERLLVSWSPGLPVRVAGSIAPVEDCYSPELVPSDAELAEEHAILARNLADAGVDLILVETQNTVREAVAAARAARATGKPLWVSFTLDDGNRLLSGESLPDAVRAVLPFAPEAILVNCIPVKQVASALTLLRQAAPSHIAIGAYGNVGHVDEIVGWTLTNAVSPEAYAEAAREWRDLGATIIGGCCGTTPEHIAALRDIDRHRP